LTVPARGSLVIDTSVVVAIILGKPRSEELAVHLENAIAGLMPAAIRISEARPGQNGAVSNLRTWRPAGRDRSRGPGG
jgi:hypothetical protein